MTRQINATFSWRYRPEVEPEVRAITMEIVDHGDRHTLKFRGAPTGFEEYRIADLFHDSRPIVERPTEMFAICAGC